MSNLQTSPTSSPSQRELPLNWEPMVVVALGAVLLVIAGFIPYFTPDPFRMINGNTLMKIEPLFLLGSPAAFLVLGLYWFKGFKAHADGLIWLGLWFLGFTIYMANSSQLVLVTTKQLSSAHLGSGFWACVFGCAFILLGGILLRFPHSNFGLIEADTDAPLTESN